MTESSLSDMIDQSREILTKRNVATFESYENRGGLKQALIYVAIAAGIAGILGLSNGISGLIQGILSTLVGFFVFTFLVYFIGKQFGGTGTLDQVAYSFALFYAPLSVLFAAITFVLVITLIGIILVPLVAIVAIVANIYFAYIAVQASMNINPGGTAWLTLLFAGLGSWVVSTLLISPFFRQP